MLIFFIYKVFLQSFPTKEQILPKGNYLRQRSTDWSWTKFSSPSIFEDKVLLEYGHSHLFAYCLWALLSHNTFWIMWLENLQCLLSGPLQKKLPDLLNEEYPLLVVLKDDMESLSFVRLWMAEEWISWHLRALLYLHPVLCWIHLRLSYYIWIPVGISPLLRTYFCGQVS